ncbi:hypothetical protein B9Z55_016823 [Caenorhabditis nigoni]|uniref:Uncharacterized protein n=1 Tax=Caenorhabditis nigoni TaxID=1611254 RepID=A0A2G5T797_9PELO|nr:hypothetical protein B9Z55_016823 [Caenorhabditis nigoni]
MGSREREKERVSQHRGKTGRSNTTQYRKMIPKKIAEVVGDTDTCRRFFVFGIFWTYMGQNVTQIWDK